MDFIKRYFINFWIWWYVVNARLILLGLIGRWSFTLSFLNVVPMLRNLFVPLYQDYSRIGIFISIPIRLVWIITGTFFQFIITIPLGIAFLVYLVLPLVPLWSIFTFILYYQ